MSVYDLYGINSDDEMQVIKQLTALLGVEFEPHESSFWGDYYRANSLEEGNFRLIENYFEAENDWHYCDYKEFIWILEVNAVNNMNDIFNKLLCEKKISISFLQRSEVEPLKFVRNYIFENGEFKMIQEIKSTST
nr:hypothetical protein [Acinetobacter sp. Marseille-Q1620]